MLETIKNYVTDTVMKWSSLDGLVLVGGGLAFLLLHPIAHWIAWGFVGYGAYKIIISKA